MFIDPFLCFCIVILILIFYYTNLYIKHQRLPPGPYGLPIFGYLPFLNPSHPYKTFTDLSQKYGSIYGIYLGSVYTVVITDAGLVREALKREEFNGRAPLYITHGIMGGFGLIVAEGDLWKDQRKFSIDCLRNMGMIKYGTNRNNLESRIRKGIDESITVFDKKLEKYLAFDPFPPLHHIFGNIINDLVFGITYEWDDDTWEYLKDLQEEGVKHIGVSGVVNFLPFLRFLPHNRKIIKFLLDGKAKTHKIYDELIKECQKSIDEETEDLEINPNVLKSFLKEKSKRKQLNDPSIEFYSDIQLRHLLADLFGAGLDTTLTTFRWFLLYVSRINKVQQNLHDEMENLISPPSLDDYDRLPYLRACLAETQRIRSVVPMGIPHGTCKDTELDGYKIPKGTMIVPLQWAIHMNSHEWKNPEEFKPKRFIDENGKFFIPKSFMPFQTGKRMCMGDELAKIILFLFASNILYHYNLTLYENPKSLDMNGTCGITLTPPEYELIFQKINK